MQVIWNIRVFWILAKLWLVGLVKPDSDKAWMQLLMGWEAVSRLLLAQFEGITDEFRYKAKAFEKPV